MRTRPRQDPGPGAASPTAPAGALDRAFLRRISIDHVWIAVATGAPAVASLVGRIGLIDLAYHLRAGEEMLATGAVPRTDTFSFVSQGDAWVDQQWLAQIVLALGYRASGFHGLQVLRAVTVAGILLFLYLACRQRGASTRSAAALTIAGGVMTFSALAIRPQLFGLVLLSASVWVLSSRDRHPGRIWLLPAFAVVWANLHGSFVLLPVILGLAVIEDVAGGRNVARLLGCALLCGLAILVNPWGPGVWTYAVGIVRSPVIRDLVTEWAPPAITSVTGVLFFGGLFATVGFLARRRDRTPWPTLLALAVFALPAVGSVRSIAWWGIVAPAVIASLFPPQMERRADAGRPGLNLLLVGGLVVAALVLSPWARGVRFVYAPGRIIAAVEDVSEVGARLFVPQPWASAFEFALPDRPVFVDSRIELYPRPVWEDYLAVETGRADWNAVLDRWDVDVFVAEADWDVVPFVLKDPAWRLVFETSTGMVFVRMR